MRIYDEAGDRELAAVTIFLTPAEAQELAQGAMAIADNPGRHHAHVMSRDGRRQVAVAVYVVENLDGFDEKSRAMLEEAVEEERTSE